MLNGIYLDMEVELSQDDDGPEFAWVTKKLQDANDIPIGTANSNPILDTYIYKVEYLDGHKALSVANTITENIFAQINNEVCCFIFLDSIIDHCVDGNQDLEEDLL